MTLLFDLDGTITDSNTLWLDIDLAFARKRGLTVTQEYTDYVVHAIFPTAAEFTKRYYSLPESPQEIMDEWFSMAYEAYAHHCPPKPGAVAYLNRCKEAGFPMALVTASEPTLCKAAIQRLGLMEHFNFLLFSQDLGLEKHHQEVWHHAAQLAGVSPQDCVVFDDSPLACAAARQAGCRDVGVYDDLRKEFKAEMQRDCWRYLDSFEGCGLFLGDGEKTLRIF
jgi:HAD superfamily hydrolase (TIGR01509 family)